MKEEISIAAAGAVSTKQDIDWIYFTYRPKYYIHAFPSTIIVWPAALAFITSLGRKGEDDAKACGFVRPMLL